MTIRRKLTIAIATLATVASAGGAYAATQQSPTNRRQAFLGDVANRLHVSPQQLTAALQGAYQDQLNAAVKAGKLTQSQASALAQRFKQNGGAAPLWLKPYPVPPAGSNPPPGPPAATGPGAGRGILGAAARYLGLSPTDLVNQLRQGKTLAQIAQQQGKTTQGLQTALTNAVTNALKPKLDQAVASGRITSAQESQILSNLSSRIAGIINGSPPAPGAHGFGARRGFFFTEPPRSGLPLPGAYGQPPVPPAGPGAPA